MRPHPRDAARRARSLRAPVGGDRREHPHTGSAGIVRRHREPRAMTSTPPSIAPASARRPAAWQVLLDQYSMMVILVVGFIAASVWVPSFASNANMKTLLLQIVQVGI